MKGSPPFGSANDPVNIAGFVAGHIARGDIATVAPEKWHPGGDFLLDVRDREELADFGRLTSAVNIPLTQLRDRLGELPRDRRIVTYLPERPTRLSCRLFVTRARF